MQPEYHISSILSSEEVAKKRLEAFGRISTCCIVTKLDPEIFHFSCTYFDRCLVTFEKEHLEEMNMEWFRRLAACATWIAIKFHGDDSVQNCAPLARVFEVAKKDMVMTELDILNRLECSLVCKTTFYVLCEAVTGLETVVGEEALNFAHQLSLLCIFSSVMQEYSLAVQACAVLFLSLAYKRYYLSKRKGIVPSLSLHEEVLKLFPIYEENVGSLSLSDAISTLERMLCHVQQSDYYQSWRTRDTALFSLRFAWHYVSYRELVYSVATLPTSPSKREYIDSVMLGCKEKKSPPKLKRCEAQ